MSWYSHLFFLVTHTWHFHCWFSFYVSQQCWWTKNLARCDWNLYVMEPQVFKSLLGESMKKEWVMSKDCIFHIVVLYWFILHFLGYFFNWISNLRPNMTYKMIKTQMFLHQTLQYSQIHNSTLNHDYKFKL